MSTQNREKYATTALQAKYVAIKSILDKTKTNSEIAIDLKVTKIKVTG